MGQTKLRPRDFIGSRAEYDPHGGTYIWGEDGNKDLQMLMDVRVRGWGAIQHLFKTVEEAEQFQDELGRWIAEAINEKLERDEQ